MKKIILIALLMAIGATSSDFFAEKLFPAARHDLKFLTYTESDAFLYFLYLKVLGYAAIFYAGVIAATQEKEGKTP
jgi:hypothetical protein